jgi:hypothetical protein
MSKTDPVEHYCSEIQMLLEGGSRITEPRAGITSDMKGRWTIGSFTHNEMGKKETPQLKELVYDNNLGAMEVGKLYRIAPQDVIDKFEKYAFSDNPKDQKTAWQILQDFLGIKLQGDGPWS